MKKTYVFTEKVHFPDIDFGGGMYHAKYFDYFDKARQALLEENGILFGDMLSSGYALVLVEANIRYLKPAILGDRIYIYTRIISNTNKSIKVEQAMFNKNMTGTLKDIDFPEPDDALSVALITLVGVDLKSKKASNMPEFLLRAVSHD